MATLDHFHTELNPIQVSLLRLFNRPMSEEEAKDLKRLMVAHYSTQLADELEHAIADKGYIRKDLDAMLNKDS